ncbi:hypothetical protein [Halalkalicoccus salilacus]
MVIHRTVRPRLPSARRNVRHARIRTAPTVMVAVTGFDVTVVPPTGFPLA